MKLLASSRPAGYAARGTSLGILGLSGLSALNPLITMMSLIPVYTKGIDLMLGALPYIIVGCLFFILVLCLSLHKRQLWFIYFIYASGCILITAYVAGFVLDLMILFGLVSLQAPDLYKLSYLCVFYWFLAGILAWFTLRLIQLRYWQPWTTPDQWERGDEAGPKWAQRMRERRFR